MKKQAETKLPTTRKAATRKAAAPVAAEATAPKKRGRPKKSDAAPAAPATKRVSFTITAAADVPVFLAGTFNNWDAESIRLEGNDGVYAAELDLAPGTYEYKFIVNGFWTMDPDPTRDWVPNGLGTLNSVVVVK